MTSCINTNINSLIAQHNLNKTQTALAAVQRSLSSGLGINSAADDAAGLAVAGELTSQIDGMRIAKRNANDIISMAQTAEGGLQAVEDCMRRLETLSLSAAQGLNTPQTSRTYNQEMNRVLADAMRIINTTNFNGLVLFRGSSDGTMPAAEGDVSLTEGNDAPGTEGNDAPRTGGDGASPRSEDPVSGSKWLTFQIGANVTDNYSSNTLSFELYDMMREGPFSDIFKAGRTLIGGQTADAKADILKYTNKLDEANKKLDNLFEDKETKKPTWEHDVKEQDSKVREAQEELDKAKAATGAETNAQHIVKVAREAIQLIARERARYGTVETTAKSIADNLEVGLPNLEAARSRIMDVDFAEASATKNLLETLQQTGMIALKEANNAPMNVLTLLRQ